MKRFAAIYLRFIPKTCKKRYGTIFALARQCERRIIKRQRFVNGIGRQVSFTRENKRFNFHQKNIIKRRVGNMNVKPMEDRVILRSMEAEAKTAGGIIIPDNAKEKPQKGEIVAVGPGKVNDKGERNAMTVKVGDKVLYGKYAGTEVTIDGQEYLIVRESDILAVV
jgi:chaperonin GroES